MNPLTKSFAVQQDTSETLLLVDDSPANLEVLSKILAPLGYHLLSTTSGERALSILQDEKPALILLDVMMPQGIDGFEVCARIKEQEATQSITVIFLSALSDVFSKVRGFEVGGTDFITKPFQAEEVLARVQTHLKLHQLRRELRQKNRELQHELQVAEYLLHDAQQRESGPLLGDSLLIRSLRQSIQKAAQVTTPLLLSGPVGTSFESVARSIHNQSRRRIRPFIHINGQALLGQQRFSFALPETVTVKGNETGEVPQCCLSLAKQGTLFLEQPEVLPLESQRELAQTFIYLETLKAQGQKPPYDIRLIVATNKEMQSTDAQLRWDPQLKQLLQSSHIVIPSLSQRKEDLPEIIQFYVKQYAQELGKVVEGFSKESIKSLTDYFWPGDIRELKNVIEHGVALATAPEIQLDMMALREGYGVMLGGYQLVDRLGQGGMGEVWRAKHRWLKRDAAVKLVRPHPEMLQKARHNLLQRFQREAHVTAQLTSPYTVKLYDFGVDRSGVFYYVMELLSGIDLHYMLEQHGALPPERVVALLKLICRSLAEAHQAGLVHRDIKPSNIYVCQVGLEFDFPKLLDFGVAKDMYHQTTPLQGGHVCGTPGYMAPEQIEGRGVSPHTDIYALGCVFYWCLTGREVFEAENLMALMLRHIAEEPTPPSQLARTPIPPELDRIVLSCLAKKPEKRPDALALHTELENLSLPQPWTQERAAQWWEEHQTTEQSQPSFEALLEATNSTLLLGSPCLEQL